MAFQAIKPHCVAFLQHVRLDDDGTNLGLLPSIIEGLSTALYSLHQHSSSPSSTVHAAQTIPIPAAAGDSRSHQSQSPGLASYAFFPFSQFLQLNTVAVLRKSPAHQAVFAQVVDCLTLLVQTLEIDPAVRGQLWTFTALTLGGPLGSKTVQDGWIKETQISALGLLSTLVKLSGSSNREKQEQLDSRGDTPLPIVAHTINTLLLLLETDEHDLVISTLDTLDALVDTYMDKRDLVPQFLPGIVSSLCKTIRSTRSNGSTITRSLNCLTSAICGAMNDARSRKAGLLPPDTSGGEADCATQPTSLEALFADIRSLGSGESYPAALSGALEGQLTSDDQTADGNPSLDSKKPGASRAWLAATSSQVHRALVSILPAIGGSSNPNVRTALVNMSEQLLLRCGRSLSNATRTALLEQLLVLSQDDWDDVSRPAREALSALTKGGHVNLRATGTVAIETLVALPHVINSHGIANEAALERHLKLLLASLHFVNQITESDAQTERWGFTLLRALRLVPVRNNSSQNPAIPGHSRNAADPWLVGNNGMLFLEDGQSPSGSTTRQSGSPPFPALQIGNIAPGRNIVLLQDCIARLAVVSTTDGRSSTSFLLDFFVGIAHSASDPALLASSLWVAAALTSGLATSAKLHTEVTQTRGARTARDLVDLALILLQAHGRVTERGRQTVKRGQTTASGLATVSDEDLQEDSLSDMQVSIQRGFNQVESLLGSDVKASAIVSSNGPSQGEAQDFDVPIVCISLRLISEAAGLVKSNFRKHLIHVLYPLLRWLSPATLGSHGLIQAYAYVTIRRVAEACAYTSSADMVLQNVDYLINAVSASLRGNGVFFSEGDEGEAGSGAHSTVRGIDPSAPSVLVAALDLAGEKILPLLSDAVEEIFDALDRWHAYDMLVSELLRVLDRLVRTVDSAQTGTAATQQEATADFVSSVVHAHQPDPGRDLADFEDWFTKRVLIQEVKPKRDFGEPVEHIQDTASRRGLPDANPEVPFAELGSKKYPEDGDEIDDNGGSASQDNDEGAQKEGEEAAGQLTGSQSVVLAIMRKSLYFLGHSSPFLRARVLALLATCVPLLSDRPEFLLPEIHRFWPYILARLDDRGAIVGERSSKDRSHPGDADVPAYVLLETIRLVNVLLACKGDFMNLRFIQDIWPRMSRAVQSLVGASSPISWGESAGSMPSSKWARQRHHDSTGISDEFSVQFRLARECLLTMTQALKSVPGIKNDDLWNIALAFRYFLQIKHHAKLRELAGNLFKMMEKVDADLTWLVLAGTAGQVEDVGWLSLHDTGLDLDLVESLLSK